MLGPRAGSFSNMYQSDLVLMYHIISGKPLNLPHFILRHMISWKNTPKKTSSLPYGMIITRLLRNFDISLEEEEELDEVPESMGRHSITVGRMKDCVPALTTDVAEKETPSKEEKKKKKEKKIEEEAAEVKSKTKLDSVKGVGTRKSPRKTQVKESSAVATTPTSEKKKKEKTA